MTRIAKSKTNTTFTSLRHNLLLAWRNLRKNRATALINIIGLSIGLATFLVIFNIVQYELSFNTKIPGADRIFRVYTSYTGSFTAVNSGVSVPVGPYIEQNVTGLDEISYFNTFGAEVKVAEKEFGRQETSVIAKPSYFNIIDQYVWIVGSPDKSLQEPFKVVLTADQAKKYFGGINWYDILGKEVVYRDSLKLEVSGIVDNLDFNSDFNFTDFISHATIGKSWLNQQYGQGEWGNTNSSSQLWVKHNENTLKSDVLLQLEDLNRHVLEQQKDADWVQSYELQPLSDLHFGSDLGIFDHSRTPAHRPTLIVLSSVAIAILLIAIFNFVNLETAQSTTKSKEVGVRKVLGSPRKKLVIRFLAESILLCFFAALLAIPISHYSIIYFQEFIPEGMALDYTNPLFWMSLLALTLIVGTVAGIYPSWVVSSFSPIKALYPGANLQKPGGGFIRKVLILFQFSFSQLLIVGTIAVTWQISYMLEKDLGFQEEGIIYFYTPYYEDYRKQELLLNELDQLPEVKAYSLQSTPPVQNGSNTSVLKYESPNGEIVMSAHQKFGDTTFLDFYGIDLLAGENLFPNDTLEQLLINETLLADLGFENEREAVGKGFEFRNQYYIIKGVIKDFHFRSLHHPIEPMVFLYSKKPRGVALKIQMGNDAQQAISKVESKWAEIYPDNQIKIRFMDETIERFYLTERRTSKLASAATGIAILISCLGLFGLISFTIIQKSKELGIRKVLGASLTHIGAILSKEFIVLIALAFTISTPISFYFIQYWMEDFAYQSEISVWVYILGGLISVIIAMFSIGAKVVKASRANPIDSLRYE